MNYDKLVADISVRSGQSRDSVREVLFHFPDALLLLGVGDDVRTPLGVFRMTKSPERNLTLPDGETVSRVPSKVQVKLRPGVRLKIPG